MSFEGLAKALEYAVDNAYHPMQTVDIDGKIYGTQELHLIGEKEKVENRYHYEPIKLTTLAGFVEYIAQNRDGLTIGKTLVQVTGPSSARLISIPDDQLEREVFLTTQAELPQITFDTFLPTENFIIMVQSCFAPSDDRDLLLKYVGNIVEDETVQSTDDGISQKIVARTGAASVDNVILPNPVKLRPYKTFQEIDQPESDFILRVRKGGQIALFAADGGTWKVTCRKLVKDALIEMLEGVDDIVIIG